MSRKTEPELAVDDVDRDEFSTNRVAARKRVQEMIRKKESFHDADLRGYDLSGMSFDGVDLSYAKLAEADLSRCSFRGANLSAASFWNANLREATLEDANLEEADFDYANLDGVSFRGAKIRKAIFPLRRVPLKDIQESVRSGRRVQMEALPLDEDD